MTNPTVLLRSMLIWALVVPVALILGYNINDLANLAITSFPIFGAFALVLLTPLFLKWHHPWLLATWNMSAVIFFVPGRPQLWMAMTGISLLISALQYAINPEKRFISVPALTWPLLLLSLIALFTAKVTGGLGMAAFGSDIIGGKRYFWIWIAVMGYFAMAGRRIPIEKAKLYTALFFLGGITMAIGDLFGIISPSFNWLFYIFPIEWVQGVDSGEGVFIRSWALPFMSIAVFCAMIARYGIRGLFDFKRPYRIVFLVMVTFAGMMGGFRSMVVILLLTAGILFYMEGLMKTKLLPALILAVILSGALITAFAKHLPLSVQRSLAVLPIEVDPIVKWDAQGSSEWRIRMWKDLLPQVPEHLLIGKGFAMNANDLDILMATLRNADPTAGAQLAGDYHNGPLSVILPLGLPGTFAFLWFLVSSVKVLHRNYKYGDPALLYINRFLFAYFLARVIFFMGVFGSLYSDLAIFTGLMGLSVSLNNGVAQPSAETLAQEAAPTFKFEPTRNRAGALT